LNNGWFIMQLPETLIGTSIAIAMLPSLSEYVTRAEEDAFRQTINRALRAMLALSLPAAGILSVAVRPLVGIVFDFGPLETEMVVWATRAFLLGLVGHCWLEVGVRSWYARQNARIPLLGALFQISLFIPLALLLSRAIGHVGLALADTVAFTSQALLLLILLNRRHAGVLRLGTTLPRAALGAVLGSACTLIVLGLPLPALLGALAGLTAGAAVALPFVWPELKTLIRL
jgi:putative peptidoglycan lipid II flippase